MQLYLQKFYQFLIGSNLNFSENLYKFKEPTHLGGCIFNKFVPTLYEIGTFPISY